MRFWIGRRRPPQPVHGDSGTSLSPSSETFYDVAMRRLDEQVERRESYSARASTTLAVGSTILPVTTGLLTLSDHKLGTCGVVLLSVSIVAFVVVVIFSMLVLLPATLDFRPDMETLNSHNDEYSANSVRTWAARECATSIGENEKRLRHKPWLLSTALGALAFETVLLAVASLLALL